MSKQALEVILEDSGILIMRGWSGVYGARQLFLCLALAALEVSCLEGSPELEPISVNMSPSKDLAKFKSPLIEINEHWSYGCFWDIKGEKALSVVETVARMLGKDVKVISDRRTKAIKQ